MRQKEINQRRCISCRITGSKTQFLRITKAPDGSISLNRGAGRSAYICPASSCITLAQKKKRLERALKTTIASEHITAIFRNLALHCQPLPALESPVKALRDVL